MPVLRIPSVILFALSCASCSGILDRPESELSYKVMRLMETYRETSGFTDVSGELCDGLSRADLERSVSELENLGVEYRVIEDPSGIMPDGTGSARFSQGAQFMYTQYLSVYVNEAAGYCKADNQIRFDFAF